ncbi:hypothetical protein P171DRAFT_426950 [Karstenula rhodostoma CBS 690.94]|uniref:Secreted protein n=1 Tax=Karstenula rhodostoma CBS 690.94 TaxID=1392251 RepID=A0A9P4UIG7_9PLEO|nr:hypothetical protein P171DRAFT_426950 [Karstenula rhodostoma CBS 690.94]
MRCGVWTGLWWGLLMESLWNRSGEGFNGDDEMPWFLTCAIELYHSYFCMLNRVVLLSTAAPVLLKVSMSGY